MRPRWAAVTRQKDLPPSPSASSYPETLHPQGTDFDGRPRTLSGKQNSLDEREVDPLLPVEVIHVHKPQLDRVLGVKPLLFDRVWLSPAKQTSTLAPSITPWGGPPNCSPEKTCRLGSSLGSHPTGSQFCLFCSDTQHGASPPTMIKLSPRLARPSSTRPRRTGHHAGSATPE